MQKFISKRISIIKSIHLAIKFYLTLKQFSSREYHIFEFKYSIISSCSSTTLKNIHERENRSVEGIRFSPTSNNIPFVPRVELTGEEDCACLRINHLPCHNLFDFYAVNRKLIAAMLYK